MNCTKCGKEIPEGDKKICKECEKKLLASMKNEEKKEDKKETVSNVKKNIEKVEDKKKETKPKKENNESNKNKIQKEVKTEETLGENKKFKIDFEKIKNNKVVIAIVAVVIIIILALVLKLGLTKFANSNSKVGNSIANIRNYGYSAEYKGWIYYVAPAKDGKQISIYKSKKDGSQTQALQTKDWDVLGLNVLGDYIYFIGLDSEKVEGSATLEDSENGVDTLNNIIYRMKLDGSELQALNTNEFHNNCYEIYVVKDRIYYIGVDSNIYYMNLDGSNKTKLNDDKTGFLGVTDKYIVLNVEKEIKESKDGEETSSKAQNGYETIVMDLNGKNRKSLTGERLYSVNVVGDYIYYDDTEKNIYKIKVDGSDKQEILKGVKAYNMNVKNNYIYYMNYIDSKDVSSSIGIYRMNLDGTDNKLIYELDNYSTFLNTVSNGVIFMDSNDKISTINLINKDGEDKILLYENKVEQNDIEDDEDTDSEEETTEETTKESQTTEEENQ